MEELRKFHELDKDKYSYRIPWKLTEFLFSFDFISLKWEGRWPLKSTLHCLCWSLKLFQYLWIKFRFMGLSVWSWNVHANAQLQYRCFLFFHLLRVLLRDLLMSIQHTAGYMKNVHLTLFITSFMRSKTFLYSYKNWSLARNNQFFSSIGFK